VDQRRDLLLCSEASANGAAVRHALGASRRRIASTFCRESERLEWLEARLACGSLMLALRCCMGWRRLRWPRVDAIRLDMVSCSSATISIRPSAVRSDSCAKVHTSQRRAEGGGPIDQRCPWAHRPRMWLVVRAKWVCPDAADRLRVLMARTFLPAASRSGYVRPRSAYLLTRAAADPHPLTTKNQQQCATHERIAAGWASAGRQPSVVLANACRWMDSSGAPFSSMSGCRWNPSHAPGQATSPV